MIIVSGGNLFFTFQNLETQLSLLGSREKSEKLEILTKVYFSSNGYTCLIFHILYEFYIYLIFLSCIFHILYILTFKVKSVRFFLCF